MTVCAVVLLFVLVVLNPFGSGGTFSVYCGVDDSWNGWNKTMFEPKSTTTSSPKVTAALCRVVGNEMMCFRFASSVTARRCSELGGVVIRINSSTSSAAAATTPIPTASSVICYHNVCTDYVVNTACFQHRLTLALHQSMFAMKRAIFVFVCPMQCIALDRIYCVYELRNYNNKFIWVPCVRPALVDQIISSVLDRSLPNLDHSLPLTSRRKLFGQSRKWVGIGSGDQICNFTPL